MLWALLLGACLSSALKTLTSSHHTSAPRLLNCTFIERANITCRWEPGDPQPSSAINYTLYIQQTSRDLRCNSSSEVVRNCSLWRVVTILICTTTGTECSVKFSRSASFRFCITVIAHTPNGVVPSTQRCQSGRKEVMLDRVKLGPVRSVRGSPLCLKITWNITSPSHFALSEEEIKQGQLISQIEYSAQGQPNAQVSNVTVNDSSFVACGFKPDTNYTIRLRHRKASEATPWSQWSDPDHGRTEEAAPAVAPQLWIQMNETDENGWRHVVLLWKPLDPSLANGFVHSYNVRCQTSSAAYILSDHGSCSVLRHNRTSCSLSLPPERCKCFLTASNSAGTSPEALIWLPGSTETEFPPISQVTVISLDDSRLDVRWTAPDDQVVTGFVVEWSAVAEQNNSSLQWKRLNGSCRQFIITGGVEPFVRYAVTVKALHGEQGAGLGRIHHVYTREGVPSAGPKVTVQEISPSSNRVELSWNSIPVEQQHGFIRNYTLRYTYSEGHTKRVFIPGDVHQYSLRNLLPGDYTICMQGNTEAGTGVEEKKDFTLGSDNADILMIMILAVVLTSVVFVLIACLAHNEMVKQTLWQDIPNPSHSSLARWTPEALWENLSVLLKAETPHIQQVVLDDEAADEAAQQNSGPVEVFSYHTVQSPNMHSSHMNAPFCPALVHTPHAATAPLDELLPIAPTESPVTSAPEEDNHPESLLSPCDSIYTQVLTSKLPQTVSQALLLSYSDHGFTDCQYTAVGFLDCELQLGGDSEPHGYEQGEHVRGSALLPSQADKLENPPLTLAEKNGLIPLLFLAPTSHVKPLPLSHLTNVCHSSSSLSLSGEESSPQCYDSPPSAFCPSHFIPFPFSCSPPVHLSEPEPGRLCAFPASLPNTFSSAFSPFRHHDMKGLLSYPFISNVFSEDCDMYISAAM